MQLKHPGRSASQHAPFPASAAILRWLRWLCPSHPPGRMMAGIQPSQPSAGGWLSRIRPSLLAAPDMSAGGSTHAARATTPLFWMAGVVISQPASESLGQDLVSSAIVRPIWLRRLYDSHHAAGRRWPGHSHRSHRPEDGCTGWKAAKMARAGRAEWPGCFNCNHVN